MSFSHETAMKLVGRGEFGELRRLAEPYLANSMTLEPRALVPLAHALVYTGESQRALSLLSTLDVHSKATNINRSHARLVLGLANRSAGSMTLALSQFQKALHLAQEAKHWDDVAWAQVYLFRHMIDSDPVDVAPAMLPAVRAAATRAGSPYIFIFLHLSVAVMEGRNGRLREGLSHCDRADSLLAQSPNPWLHCGNLQNRSAILVSLCRFADALETLESLKRSALLHGLTNEAVKAQSNIGQVLWMTGEHDRAIELLRNVVASPSTSRLTSMYALESLSEAYLWKGDFERCEEVLTHFESAASQDSELAKNYALRQTVLTRARLLLKTNRSQEALDHLAQVERKYPGTADTPAAIGLSILTVQALAQCGRLADAARQLGRADQLGGSANRELQGRFYEAASMLVAREHRLAMALAERATRVWKTHGTTWMRGTTLIDQSPVAEHVSTVEIVNRLASTLDLAHDPRLAVTEVVSVLNSLGCVVTARRYAHEGEQSAGVASAVASVTLGSKDGETWHLEYEPPAAPDKVLVLSDVVRIARAAFALEHFKASAQNRTAFWPPEPDLGEGGALFLSPEMRSLAETAARVAATDIPILITGETGTGKEVLARLIHAKSSRGKKPFLPFNCTSVPREMMDSQLFGHRRGAFTGASDNFQGVIRSARGGTLLLDEIGDLGLESQPKLLRFLESGEVLPLGESSPVQADVRVIAATNADLDAAVSNGRFREDLYYRLNIVQLRVPPLRQRRVEIPSLSRHYLQMFATQFNKGDLRLEEETLESLVLFNWPGNIRQLANEMRRLAALAEDGAVLMPDALSPEIYKSRGELPPLASSPPVESDRLLVRLDQPIAEVVEGIERAMLRFAMERHEGRVDAVAKALGLSRKGLYLKRQRYRIDGFGAGSA